MLSPIVVYSSTPKAVRRTSVVAPSLTALWLIYKDFSRKMAGQNSSIPAALHICETSATGSPTTLE